MKEKLKPIIVSDDISIREAMEKITGSPHADPPGPSGMLLVVDKAGVLAGVLTDGDIRKALLGGKDFNDRIFGIMNRRPIKTRHNIPTHEMLIHVHEEARKRNYPISRIDKLVIVDEDDRPLDVLNFFELWKRGDVKSRTVSIIGLGYVGLTLALTFAESGYRVIGVDVNRELVKSLKAGKLHIYEKGLEELFKKHLDSKFFVRDSFTPRESDVYIICVGTPVGPDHQIILNDLSAAIGEVAKILKPYDLVIFRSTVPIGTIRGVALPLLEEKTGLKADGDFFLSFAPERTAQGKALDEIRLLPQIVGGYNQASTELTANLFASVSKSIINVSSLEAAESVKLVNNTFRDLIFSYANELAVMLDGFGLNTYEVIRAANENYERNNIPYPSPGVGGYCLPKDPFIYINSAAKVGHEPKLPYLSREINDSMIGFVSGKVLGFLDKHGLGKTAKVFIMGLAFKGDPATGDVRNSTALQIMEMIRQKYPRVHIYDPVVDNNVIAGYGAKGVDSLAEGFKQANCVMILNNHLDFRGLDLHSLAQSSGRPCLFFDGWGMYLDYDWSSLDHILYDGLGVGRPAQKQKK